MCTAATYLTQDFYFGRTLDIEYRFNEAVAITPRNFLLNFKKANSIQNHYAIIGIATTKDNYPLYYDATNEMGLSMAGLSFPQNAYYLPFKEDMDNITPFEFIPWILSQCKSVTEAEVLLKKINLVDISFSDKLPLSPLHFLISDREKSITVEPTKEGLKIYDNPVGILTNNPPFDVQLFNLNNYMYLSNTNPENTFAPTLSLDAYSRGMGAIGLPGDLSSSSRFVKATFTKINSISEATEEESISQFFHILNSVCQQRGCVVTESGEYEITYYTSCCNTDKGIYYYTTYDNSQISAIDMHKENLDSSRLISYPLITKQNIKWQN